MENTKLKILEFGYKTYWTLAYSNNLKISRKENIITKNIHIILMASLLFTSLNTNAASGSAILPYWHLELNTNGSTTNTTRPFIQMSNITNKNIKVQVIFYKSDGTVFRDSGSTTTNDYDGGTVRGCINTLNYKDNSAPAKISVSFTIPPRQSCRAYLELATINTNFSGHAIVEWKQNSRALVGLVAQYKELFNSQNSYVPINGGLPF